MASDSVSPITIPPALEQHLEGHTEIISAMVIHLAREFGTTPDDVIDKLANDALGLARKCCQYKAGGTQCHQVAAEVNAWYKNHCQLMRRIGLGNVGNLKTLHGIPPPTYCQFILLANVSRHLAYYQRLRQEKAIRDRQIRQQQVIATKVAASQSTKQPRQPKISVFGRIVGFVRRLFRH